MNNIIYVSMHYMSLYFNYIMLFFQLELLLFTYSNIYIFTYLNIYIKDLYI